MIEHFGVTIERGEKSGLYFIYGNVGWDCATFNDDGLKELVAKLKEIKPELMR